MRYIKNKALNIASIIMLAINNYMYKFKIKKIKFFLLILIKIKFVKIRKILIIIHAFKLQI
jgi:hypothetical protein